MEAEFRNLAVLVVSWNQAERLARCLESVMHFLPGAQVIIVDNGSEIPLRPENFLPSTRELIADNGSEIPLRPENLLPSSREVITDKGAGEEGARSGMGVQPSPLAHQQPPREVGLRAGDGNGTKTGADKQPTGEAGLSSGVTVLRSPVNLGYAGGNNLGWAKARESKYVLLLNNDTRLPSAEPIRTLRSFLESHPACAAAQASLQLPDGTMDACGELLTRPFGVLYHRGYRQAPGAEASKARPVFAGKGACLLLRSEAVDAVGGVLFRPEFFCYYEDVDLCHRLWLAGREVWYVPTEPVLHEERATARGLPARKVWRHYLSNMLTSAFDLWGWRAWLTMGAGFLGAVVAGAAVKGVLPRPKRSRVRFERKAREGEFLPRVTVCPAPSYYWKVLKGLIAR